MRRPGRNFIRKAFLLICLVLSLDPVEAYDIDAKLGNSYDEKRIDHLRKQGDNLFKQQKYRKAYKIYKQVAKMRKADLQDLRKCSDMCSRIAQELEPGQPDHTSWLQEWAVWASYAANHPTSDLQDLRNAAGIYYSLRDYDNAIKFRKRAAEHKDAEWDDYINLALTLRFARKHMEAYKWYQKVLDHPEAITNPKDVEEFIKKYNSLH